MLLTETREKLKELHRRVTEGDLSDRSELSLQVFISKIDLIVSEEKIASERKKEKQQHES
jgi:hypothetical protein